MTVSPELSDPSLLKAAAYVGGRWVESWRGLAPASCATPPTARALAELPQLSRAEVADAKEWSRVLRAWFDLVTANADDLARLIVLEEGKPFAEARGEVAYAASFIEWFAEEAKRVRGDVMSAPKRTRRVVVTREPVDVCAAITPWNFPAAMITRKAAPALAARVARWW